MRRKINEIGVYILADDRCTGVFLVLAAFWLAFFDRTECVPVTGKFGAADGGTASTVAAALRREILGCARIEIWDGVRKVHGSVPPKDRFTEGLTSGRGYRTLIRTKKER